MRRERCKTEVKAVAGKTETEIAREPTPHEPHTSLKIAREHRSCTQSKSSKNQTIQTAYLTLIPSSSQNSEKN
jgi:hypothetical protein